MPNHLKARRPLPWPRRHGCATCRSCGGRPHRGNARQLARYGIVGSAQLLDFAIGTAGTPDTADAIDNAALYLRSATAQVLSRALSRPPSL